MSIQTTSSPTSNAYRTKYSSDWLESIRGKRRVYDVYTVPVGSPKFAMEQSGSWLASTYQFAFASDMTPATSAISQTVDITPQVLRDSTATITTTSRGDALQWAEAVDIQSYLPYGKARFSALGENRMESIDLLARDAALTGDFVKSSAARASLDAGTAADRFTDATIAKAQARVNGLHCPTFDNGRLLVTIHTDLYYDLVQGGNVVTIAQQVLPEILMKQKLDSWGDFMINPTAYAKVFGAAGADNASNVATTLNGAVNALATSIIVASASNIVAGMQLTIGTEETGDTHYPTNEIVYVQNDYTSGTTIPIVGEGANGGLRFDHATGAGVRNADNAYPAVFGGRSLIKAFANEHGEFGEVIGPKESGILNQFRSLGWIFYGGVGLVAENYIFRSEHSSSLQA
jgi:hypothetical protein